MTARTDVDAIKEQVMKDLAIVRHTLDRCGYFDDSQEATDQAFHSLEQFVNIALRILNKTNPSKVRSEALTVAVHAKLNGAKEV